jgi:hypothetical protein
LADRLLEKPDKRLLAQLPDEMDAATILQAIRDHVETMCAPKEPTPELRAVFSFRNVHASNWELSSTRRKRLVGAIAVGLGAVLGTILIIVEPWRNVQPDSPLEGRRPTISALDDRNSAALAIQMAEKEYREGHVVEALSQYRHAYGLLPNSIKRKIGPAPRIREKNLHAYSAVIDSYQKMFTQSIKDSLYAGASPVLPQAIPGSTEQQTESTGQTAGVDNIRR